MSLFESVHIFLKKKTKKFRLFGISKQNLMNQSLVPTYSPTLAPNNNLLIEKIEYGLLYFIVAFVALGLVCCPISVYIYRQEQKERKRIATIKYRDDMVRKSGVSIPLYYPNFLDRC